MEQAKPLTQLLMLAALYHDQHTNNKVNIVTTNHELEMTLDKLND